MIGHQKSLFTISLADASANKLINEIEIKDDFAKFLKTLSMVYSRAPYKEPAYALISGICAYEDKNLAHFIGNSLREIARYLDIQTEFVYSSELSKDNQLGAQDKVIAICQELNADVYINAIGGQELYDRDAFKAQGISLKFIRSLPVEYRQLGRAFVPGLSIIDALMFNSSEKVSGMLTQYELV